MTLSVRPCRGRRDTETFVRLPWSIYRGDPNWVPPLLRDERARIDRRRHPFFDHAEAEFYLAWRGSEPVGRIAAIHNRLHNETVGDRAGFFGLFECANDAEAAAALIAEAEEWLASRGLDECRGPFNLSIHDTCGLLVDGFQWPPFILMTYNPPWYEPLITAAGYEKAMDLYAYFVPAKDLVLDRFRKVAEKVDRTRVQVRFIDMGRFDREVAIVRDIYNRAWEKNWGMVPMTDREFQAMAKDLKPFVLPFFNYIAEVDGKPAGFGLALPDLNQILKRLNGRLFPFGWLKVLLGFKRIPVIRIVALGVLPEYQGLGVGSLLILKYIEEGLPRGCKGAEMSWVLESNHLMNKPLLDLGAKPYKTYRLYRRSLHKPDLVNTPEGGV